MNFDLKDIKGHFFLVVAPSGAGKSTLIQHVLEHRPNLYFPVSATTRSMRPGEINGKEYYFFTPQEFEDKISKGEFLEYAQVHGQTYYGTLASEVLEPLTKGQDVIRSIDYQGARNICKVIPRDHVHVIYVDGGDWETLCSRITHRNPMSTDEIERRRQSYILEQDFAPEADFIISNQTGEMEQAKARLLSIISSFDTMSS